MPILSRDATRSVDDDVRIAAAGRPSAACSKPAEGGAEPAVYS
jgi:hypothetical protein